MAEITTDATIRETSRDNAEQTLREGEAGPPAGELTVREGTLASPDEPSPSGIAKIDGRETFRGYAVLEQLPTKGAEADIYILEREGERHILKLYRHRMEPKIEVLNRIGEISRAHSECFVVFRDAGFDEQTGRWYELQEYFPLGSLKDIPEERKRRPDFIRSLVSELAEAIHCLHKNDIIHCDIKPGNVLVRSLDPVDLVLTDFGIASIVASDVSRKMTTLKGTPMYWAPEAFSRMVGRPCDWWGLGMIILELLAGAHPLEGLMDSQIIHRLTVGNVEIPSFLDDNWRLLLKGLLTKDDVRRWGYAEVLRWLAGERDIPVWYEAPAPSAFAPKRETQPFRFEGRDLYTLEELAAAICQRDQPWAMAAQYLRYIRQWMENNMLFDEAVDLGNAADTMDSERALFHFVHTFVKGPFVYLGRVIDANNLRLFLSRVARREAGYSEGRIVRMLGDGTLKTLYEEYTELTQRQDPVLEAIFPVMLNRTAEEQWACFEAAASPKDFIWPKDVDLDNEIGLFSVLNHIGAAPIRSETLANLDVLYLIPDCIRRAFDSSETFAWGLKRLNELQDEGLLIPQGSGGGPLGFATRDMSFEEYKAHARVICLGHTPAVMAHLSAAIEALDTLPLPPESPDALLPSRSDLESAAVSKALSRLRALRNEKIGPRDTLFLARLSELFRTRRTLQKGRNVMYLVWGSTGALVLWIIHLVAGVGGAFLLQTVFIIAVVGGLVAALFTVDPHAFRRLQRNRTPGWNSGKEAGEENPRQRKNPDYYLVLPIFAVLGTFLFFNLFLAAFPRLFPPATGVMAGCCAYFMFFQRRMRGIFSRISELCAGWLGSAP
ncbi:MAG: protein kinase [Synergistaceae bacterium]|jgi:serine/threonine protein kinase|nr:protein kinase [Synergistaceae bacterium]